MHDSNEAVISITFMSGPWDGKTITWESPTEDNERILTIGRREGCDIILDFDSQVSRVHARVVYETHNGLFYLEDADSRNGTFLAGDRVKGRVALPQGELFRVGRTWMRIDSPPSTDEVERVDDLPF